MNAITVWKYLSWGIAIGIAIPVMAQTPERPLQHYEYTQLHMGVQVQIQLYAPNEEKALEAVHAAFARYSQLNDILSDYKADSELNLLCDHAGKGPMHVSDDLWRNLERAQEVAKRSNGAFDPTVSPLVRLWRSARKLAVMPNSMELKKAKKLVNWRALKLDASSYTAELLKPGMKLDLGGIAKGDADDQAQVELKKCGITSSLIEAGGDIVVSDPPPGKKGWVIEIANPGKGMKTKLITVSNCAVSTSGDTEQFVVIGGKQYSHIVDPHTGLGLTDRIAATIVAKDGLTSDSLSTAVSVLGEKKGQLLVKTYPGASAYVRTVGR